MAVQHQGWIDLDGVIADYMDEAEVSIHKYAKLFNLAFRALDELGLDFFYQIKSIFLPVLGNKTVQLPADFLTYSKVGIINRNGEVIPLIYNSKLTTFADLLPNRVPQLQDLSPEWNFNGNTNVFYNFWNGGSVTNLYGVPSGSPFIGTFKIDPANGVILFGENFCYENICLEYTASPTQGEPYYLPLQFREAVISYMRWKDIISLPSTRKGSIGDKDQRRREWFNDRRLAKARYTPFSLDQAYIWSLESTRMCLKG